MDLFCAWSDTDAESVRSLSRKLIQVAVVSRRIGWPKPVREPERAGCGNRGASGESDMLANIFRKSIDLALSLQL